MTNSIFKTLLKSIIETNGASYNFITREINPGTGYMVPIKGYERNYRKPRNTDDLTGIMFDYIADVPVYTRIKNDTAIYIGFWVNDEGRLILDLSENIADEFDAITKGVARKQKAIYDCNNKKDIAIPFL